MGKQTGFLEYERKEELAESPKKRLKHYKEFVVTLKDADAKIQGARCMDCGIPFCNTGCPVNNIIPDFNDWVYKQDWKNALASLHSTNNFPEFTGRICPAPCEAACTLGINENPVAIKSIERAIIDKGWQQGWVLPQPARKTTGQKVAVVGSGPAGLAAAQQLARVGHSVTVYEKNDRIGGLLRYGIPDFKLEKHWIDQRVEQMQAEGVHFVTSTLIGEAFEGRGVNDWSKKSIKAEKLLNQYDAIVLAMGAEVPRDLRIPGRESAGIHFAMEFLPLQNRVNAGDSIPNQLVATGKQVLVIGGGDTGSDCVGTSNRQGAKQVVQIELMPQPPIEENKPLVWPYWPMKLRTSSSHEEGVERDWAVTTKQFIANSAGHVKAALCAKVDWIKDPKTGQMILQEIQGSEFEIAADLVLFAMGFTNPVARFLKQFDIELDARGNAKASTDGKQCYRTTQSKVFACGDVRRGQSLVVWAIREGRQAAREVDAFLMGSSLLPR